MTEIERLEKTILDLHGCKSKYLRSVPVYEVFEGETVWQGSVEVFELQGHSRAKVAYAWSYKADDEKNRYVAVLGVPPIDSPNDAIKAYVAAQVQKKGK